MFRAPSYGSGSRTFGVFETALVSTDGGVDLGVDLVDEDPTVDMVEYLASITRVGAQSVTVGLPKLTVRLGLYNKD